MVSSVTIVAGPARSGKTERVLSIYRRALAEGPLGSALWLSPTRRAVDQVREQLSDGCLPACLRPNCFTFDQLANVSLETAPIAVRPITELMKRELLGRLIRQAVEAGRMEYFAPIAHTAGMLELLSGFITELKRLEIWPEQFNEACRQQGRSRKDRELWGLYHEYQLLLNRHDLYDAEGRFWTARTMLRESAQPPLDRLRVVLVDGFADFTRTQHEVLELLAQRAEALCITLPLERDDARSDLFAKPRRTFDCLHRRYPNLRVEYLDRGAGRMPSAIAHLEAHLFGRHDRTAAASESDSIELIAASGELAEIELVAAKIKRLLTQGDGGDRVPPDEIVVVFRSLTSAAPLIREVFHEMGIPLALEAREPLARSSVIGTLLSLLALELEDWPLRRLIATLGHNYFCPDWPEYLGGRAVIAAEQLIRCLQIPSGRLQLLGAAERMAERARGMPSDSSGESETLADTRGKKTKMRDRWAEIAHPLLKRLAATLATLPTHATAGKWAAALQALAEGIGLLRAVDSSDIHTKDLPMEVQAECAAFTQLLEALRQSERLSSWLGEESPRLALRELYARLMKMTQYLDMPRQSSEHGRVRVLGASSARNIAARYVFVAGLSEKSFPSPERDDRFYGDADYRRLTKAGLPLTTRAARVQDEMLLFYEVLTRATRRLYLSYPALDSSAQPLSPSPYLKEVERAYDVGAARPQLQINLSPVPRSEELYCPRDLRVKALATALDGDARLLGGIYRCEPRRGLYDNLIAGLRCVWDRQKNKEFGRFDGMLLGDKALAHLADRFGPQRCWSASRLEQYASCPHRFFLERVLGLEPLDEPGLSVDYMARGRRLHETLAILHRHSNDEAGRPASPLVTQPERYTQMSAEIIEGILAARRTEDPLELAWREVDRRLLIEFMAQYRQQHESYEEKPDVRESALRPAHFEVSFGPVHDEEDDDLQRPPLENADPLSTPDPYSLQCGSDTVQLSGRIDRIDLGTAAGRMVFNIVDYKSGSAGHFSAKAVSEGAVLQLPLYALAVQDLLLAEHNAAPWRAAYWFVKSDGYKEALAFHRLEKNDLRVSNDWRILREEVVRRVFSLVHGIRRGQFPMYSADDKCTSYCQFRTVCRVQQARALEKTWQPPAPDIV